MLLIGLTGSIATGKSTVSSLLTSPSGPHRLPLIDADVLARKAVDPGTSAYRRIVEYFGPSTPDLLVQQTERGEGKEGKPLNRAVLGRRVFGDSPEKQRDRKVLNEIVHPAVRWEMYKALLYYYVKGYWAVVLDVPLLFESGLDLMCGAVVVVAVKDQEVQVQRLLRRDREMGGGMTREEAEGRVGSQWSVMEKVGRCEARDQGLLLGGNVGRGYVIWNDGVKEELTGEVEEVMKKVRERSPGWWSWICLLMPPVGVVAGALEMLRNRVNRWRWETGQKEKGTGKSERAKL